VMVRADGTVVGVGDPRRHGAAAAAGKPTMAALAPLFPGCGRSP
jgi:hypothetical protein